MPLLTRIYFNAVFGALGGLLGWMLFGVFGEKSPTGEYVVLFLTQHDLNMILGGAIIGGFVGGALFELFYAEARSAPGGTDYFWSAMGLVILGACIGSLSALVQAAFQPASVRVLRGWQEGREYPLEKPASLLGRAEHADIALFRDMSIEKQHAYIRRVNEQYVLVNNGAPAAQTLVNELPIAAS